MRPPAPLPTPLLQLAAAQERLVSTSQCEAHGVDRRRLSRLAAQGRWVRVTTGVYDTDPTPALDRRLPDVFDHRRRRAAWLGLLAHGPHAIAVGQSALALHGVQGLPLVVRPEVMLADGSARRGRDGVVVRQLETGLPTTTVSGRQVVTALCALAQAVPALQRSRAVAVLDSAVHLGRIRRADVEEAHDLARGRPGVGRTHGWWQLVDGRAESPLETFARLDCLDAGVPPDDLQHEFFAPSGELLGRGDMVWRLPDGRRLLLEVDGADVHDAPVAVYRDRERQNRLVVEGDVLVQRTTWRELRTPGTVGRRMAGILHRLGWSPSTA